MIPIKYAESGKIPLPDIIIKMIQISRHWIYMKKTSQANRVLIVFFKWALITKAQKES